MLIFKGTQLVKYKQGKKREEKVKKILEAAELEFVKHGFKGTTMKSIALCADMPKANVLYYFKSKEILYNELLQSIMMRWNDILFDLTIDDDPATILELYIRKKVSMAFTEPNASKIFAMEIIQGASNVTDYLKVNMRTWLREKTEVIQNWIDNGKMKNVDPQSLIYLIWASTQHYADFSTQILTINNKVEFEDLDQKNISDFLVNMILTGCGLESKTKSEKI